MSRIYKIQQLSSGSVRITKSTLFDCQLVSSASIANTGGNNIKIQDWTSKVFEFNINNLYSITDNSGITTLITSSFSVDDVYAILEPFFL